MKLLLGGAGVMIALVAACGSDAGSTFTNGGSSGADGGNGPPGGFPTGGDGGSSGSGTGTSGGPACATGEAAAVREPVYINMILDGSRSMDGHANKSAGCDTTHSAGGADTCFIKDARESDPLAPQRDRKVCHDDGKAVAECASYRGLTGKKWLAIRGGLLAFFDTVKANDDRRFGLGMLLFGSEAPPPGAPTYNQWDIKPAFVDQPQLDKLRARILPPNFPTTSGTPLKESINGQAPLLTGFAPTAPLVEGGKRILVIVTDGAASTCDSKPACPDIVAKVKALREGTPSVTTFVIGVGDPATSDDSVYSETFLSNLANAGGAAPAGCNAAWNGAAPTGIPCHFQVTPGAKTAQQIQAEISAAMTSIAASVQSCELALNKTSPIDPTKVNVVYTPKTGADKQVAKDAANGWAYDDEASPSKVILNGASCTELKADPGARVSIVVGCPTGTGVR